MSLSLVLSIVALVLAIVAAIMWRPLSTPFLLIVAAVILVATVQVLGGGLSVR